MRSNMRCLGTVVSSGDLSLTESGRYHLPAITGIGFPSSLSLLPNDFKSLFNDPFQLVTSLIRIRINSGPGQEKGQDMRQYPQNIASNDWKTGSSRVFRRKIQRAGCLIVCSLLLLSGQAAGQAIGQVASTPDDRLSATWLDTPMPGERVRLAVNWRRSTSTPITIELSGQIIQTLEVQPGLSVIDVALPSAAAPDALTLRAESSITLPKQNRNTQGDCAWLPGAVANGVGDSVKDFIVFDDGSGEALYLGGDAGISRWDGSDWSEPGGGIDGSVEALMIWDDGSGPALFAGGSFSEAGGVPAENIARLDGSTWTALGLGTESRSGTGRTGSRWVPGSTTPSKR